ncbi:MAG TPA: polyphosphate kinase 1 [Methanocorpusculum sp.]|nr:polyphosphate kinase 1 [Methanocorpusculum sp.]
MKEKQRTYTQNRELSWLKFNERVLREADDSTVPLLERLKFIAIFTSNLDEFFMIRVGSLYDLMLMKPDILDSRTGMTPKEQLEAVFAAVKPLYKKREAIYKKVEKNLEEAGVKNCSMKNLSGDEKKYIRQYFKFSVAPVLSPQIVDLRHPFPHLQNNVLHIGAILKDGKKKFFGIIQVPQTLPGIVVIPGSNLRYVRTEDIILDRMDAVFSMYEVKEKTVFCVTRNADVNLSDEAFADTNADFRHIMRDALLKRRKLAPVRLELNKKVSEDFTGYLCKMLSLAPAQVYVTTAPLLLSYAFDLEKEISKNLKDILTYPPFTPYIPACIPGSVPVHRQLIKHDILLSYPFESMKPFLRMIKEAAYDKNTISIKITIYRLAHKTKLVDYLCAAAENGIDVTVFIELRARFDEQNNIDWSEFLEDAGCKIIYGFEDYKVHSKICLITRKERGAIKYYTQIGTGNYNEKTAEQYTDLSIMTANQEIGAEADLFFKNMALANLHGSYKLLLVSPSGLKSTVLKLMDDEIKKKQNGRILVKINSLTDIDIIDKLKEASCAGVKVDMIVRGICCIIPGIPGETENITVRNIVGRFLEHSRIYVFGTGAEEKMYIASADFMTRNTERRVEVGCPVLDAEVRRRIHHILDLIMRDNVKARRLLPDGTYTRFEAAGEMINSQNILAEEAKEESVNPD